MNTLTLEPFSPQNTDMVLSWRNSARVRCNSIDDSIITKESHNLFLNTLSQHTSKRYFVMHMGTQPVGVLSFSGIGQDQVTWGCYIGSEKISPGTFPLMVCIAIKFAFQFESTASLHSEVAAHNHAPLKLNQYLGVDSTGEITKKTTSGKVVQFMQFCVSKDDVKKVLDKAEKILTSSLRTQLNSFKVLNEQ